MVRQRRHCRLSWLALGSKLRALILAQSVLRDLSRFDISDEIMLVHDILARRFN